MGIFDFLFNRHAVDVDPEGSSPKNAIVVGSVKEEYLWMQSNCIGFQRKARAMQEINGKPYDVHVLRNDKGEERTVYFDISWFY